MLLKFLGGTEVVVYYIQYYSEEMAGGKQGKREQHAHQSVSKARWFFYLLSFSVSF